MRMTVEEYRARIVGDVKRARTESEAILIIRHANTWIQRSSLSVEEGRWFWGHLATDLRNEQEVAGGESAAALSAIIQAAQDAIAEASPPRR